MSHSTLTSTIEDTEEARAGRWAGTGKTECGIHWTHNGREIPALSTVHN